MAHVRDVVAAIDRAAPLPLQLDFDNCGLLVGDPQAAVRRLLVALDPTLAAVREARRHRAQCLVTHHPVFLSAPKQLTSETHGGAIALAAAEGRVALVAAHTNYDASAEGLSQILAARLGLTDVEPLERPARRKAYKLIVFLPEGDLAAVQRAIFAAGAGRIGDYTECSFSVSGTGTFRGAEWTHPAIGRAGQLEHVPELRLEAVVAAERVDAALAAMREAHSYEEPAFDLVPVEVPYARAGLGRVEMLAKPESMAAFIARVKRAFGVPTVEVIGDLKGRVSRVATLGGSGGDFWPAAVRARADVYVTGEMKHHDRLAAREAGLTVILAGHWSTEHPAVAGLARILTAALPGVEVIPSTDETNPTTWR